jgi:hypothetical protein
MKVNLKKLGAGMLALAVVGSVSGFLTTSLAGTQSPVGAQPATAMDTTIRQTAIETIVVIGQRPTNYAGLVTHHKHNGTARPEYASAQRRGSNSVVLK